MSSFRAERTARKPYNRPSPRGDADGQWLHDKAPTGPRINANGTGRPRHAVVPASAINTRLAVSNLHYEITPKDLTAIFGQIGTLVREPLIRYDRSGRSSGTAIIAFETPAEATRAKKQFNGILAKGQPMSIEFDTPPPHARRSASAPVLLNRIQKLPLLDRLSRDDVHVKTPSGPRGGVGPVRSRPPRAGGARAGPKKPKTAEELDKELDAFMGDSETVAPIAQEETLVSPIQDVEMA
ncbi:hypothetical protein BDZ94DRAFT_1291802 [Collybia nuda]|uniref:RRM domain-containing protein n=1 Tax=Collybia nuda TaxID=64659 RepID=A0A9P6CB22_9AGAR|nr:hypothetical protein BDZ94DRAFT_1291802 [Collybia nuda]